MINASEIYKKGSDLYFEAKNAKRVSKEQSSWYISGLGTCMVARYLKRKALLPEQPIDDRLREVFDIGDMEESIFVDRLKLVPGFKFETQGRVEDKTLGISGYYDLKITDETTGESSIIEHKSKHSRAFWYMDKKKEGANLHHKMQLWSYLFLDKVETGSIFYRSKDDRCTLEYPLFRTDEEVKKLVMTELAILNYCLKNDIVPPLPEKKSWQENYCDCHDTCKKYWEENKHLTFEEVPNEEEHKELAELLTTYYNYEV